MSTLVPCELTIPATAKVVIDITAQSPSPMSCCLEILSFGLIIDIGIEHGLEYRFIYFEVSKFLFCLIIFASLVDREEVAWYDLLAVLWIFSFILEDFRSLTSYWLWRLLNLDLLFLGQYIGCTNRAGGEPRTERRPSGGG